MEANLLQSIEYAELEANHEETQSTDNQHVASNASILSTTPLCPSSLPPPYSISAETYASTTSSVTSHSQSYLPPYYPTPAAGTLNGPPYYPTPATGTLNGPPYYPTPATGTLSGPSYYPTPATGTLSGPPYYPTPAIGTLNGPPYYPTPATGTPNGPPPSYYQFLRPHQQQQQQQQQQQVVLARTQPTPVPIVVPATSEMRTSFNGAIVLSCMVFWFCGFLFGGIAFLLALIGRSAAGEGNDQTAHRLKYTSYRFSIIGILVGIGLIIAGGIMASRVSSISSTSYSGYYTYYNSYQYRQCSYTSHSSFYTYYYSCRS